MARQRVPTETIDSDFENGDVLYGSDINQIIDVFRQAANENKLEINKILTGSDYFYVADTVQGLNDLRDETTPSDGAKGFVFDGSGTDEHLEMYQYTSSSNSWTFVSNFSLLSLLSDIEEVRNQSNIHYDELPATAKVGDLFIDYD